MINSKNKKLSSLIDSKRGLHLTIYTQFDGDVIRFRTQLRQLLLTAEEHLDPVLSTEQKNLFLKPIFDLAFDPATLKRFKGNIAIFRKNDFFNLKSIPLDIDDMCVVADSFHIKPLISWAQQDQDFLLVGLSANEAKLYFGNQSELKKVDTAVYPDFLRQLKYDSGPVSMREIRLQKMQLQQTMQWMASWIDELIHGKALTVFVAGDFENVTAFLKNSRCQTIYPETLTPHFSEAHLPDMCSRIREILKLDSKKQCRASLEEVELAQLEKTAKTNIFQIAKAAINGTVKKLVIAKDFHIFGKLDRSTGGIALHTADLDHEDDCLLDDLAQTVLIKGGEVVVVNKSEIPMGRPIVAVLYPQQTSAFAKSPNPTAIAV